MTMINEEDDERQSLYARKYSKMVKQFDELIEIMDGKATQPKERRCPRKQRSNSAVGGNHIALPAGKSNGRATAAGKARSNPKSAPKSQLAENNMMLVQTITRHLQELKNDYPPDSDSFNPTI